MDVYLNVKGLHKNEVGEDLKISPPFRSRGDSPHSVNTGKIIQSADSFDREGRVSFYLTRVPEEHYRIIESELTLGENFEMVLEQGTPATFSFVEDEGGQIVIG
jgi:hypothetical protein